tara:strand:+ start:796 stop:2082 length:1287 start_codon:yes stop_codon:yes gene_type:complete
MGRSRDIAEFLSKTEFNNPTNTSLLKSTDTTGIDSAAVQGIGLTSFSTLDSLPVTNLVVGQQAYVTGTSRLYISNGVGWYNTTLVNRSPTWDSEPLSTYEIVDSATPLIITAKALDSDTSLNYLVDQSSATDSAQYMVNITSDSSVFTFTPKSADSIGIEVAAGNLTDSNGDFEYTFKWSDGISFVSKVSTISYSPATGGNNDITAYRGFTQGVFGSTFGNATANTTLSMPAGSAEGDKAIIVIGGMGWTANSGSAAISFPNGEFTLTDEYQWGYAAGQTSYRTNLYTCDVVTAEMISNGVVVNNDSPGANATDYKMMTLVGMGGAAQPIYNSAQINYTGSYNNGSYYSAASAAPPTGYQSKTHMVEVHTTRSGYRTYTSTTNSTLGGSIYRSIYYLQALYVAGSVGQMYHRWQAGDAYSAQSLCVAW